MELQGTLWIAVPGRTLEPIRQADGSMAVWEPERQVGFNIAIIRRPDGRVDDYQETCE